MIINLNHYSAIFIYADIIFTVLSSTIKRYDIVFGFSYLRDMNIPFNLYLQVSFNEKFKIAGSIVYV